MTRLHSLAALLLCAACGDQAGDTGLITSASISATASATSTDGGSSSTGTTSGPGTGGSASADSTSEGATSENSATRASFGTSDTEATGGAGCTFCDAPNQRCVDDVCQTTCQGVQPDPCGPLQVCDHISGECVDPGGDCVLSGDFTTCGFQQCGPGTACDDQGSCIPYPPCAGVACTDDGACWGSFCSCERNIDCAVPTDEQLNGPFATEIVDLEFADDCTAWMVTLRSGTDYLRRLTPEGELTEWAGVSNLKMGEVAVLKALTPPPGAAVPLPVGAGTVPPPPEPVQGIGEVALSYICCATCGCASDPPQGVARLDEENPANPLPLVIPAGLTNSTGPFGVTGADAGPYGLTWGIDRVLYVGNAISNGDINTADLELGTQQVLTTFEERVSAASPLTEVHIMVATLGGAIYRLNILTNTATLVATVEDDVTSIAFDSFSGLLYVSLRNFEVVRVDPFSGAVFPFETMPDRGRVTVSPDGRLYYSPIGYISALPISSWDIPDSL